jgi:hypothetical protein
MERMHSQRMKLDRACECCWEIMPEQQSVRKIENSKKLYFLEANLEILSKTTKQNADK